MTRRHDERWAVPIGNDEYVHHLEEEFYRLRQVERTLEGNIDFLRSERDRLKDGIEELRIAMGLTREEVFRLRKIEQAAREFHDAWAELDSALADVADVKEVRVAKVRLEKSEQVLDDALSPEPGPDPYLET